MRLLYKILWSCMIFALPSCLTNYIGKLPNLHQMMTREELGKYFAVEKHDEVPKYEVVNIRMKRGHPSIPDRLSHKRSQRSPSDDFFIFIDSVFGNTVHMKLVKNRNLVVPSFTAVRIADDREEDVTPPVDNCHYLGSNGSIMAAISKCGYGDFLGGLRGIVFLPDGAVNVQPVDPKFTEMLGTKNADGREFPDYEEQGIPHIITRPRLSKRLTVQDESEIWDDERFLPPHPRDEYELEDTEILKNLDSDYDDLNSISDDPLLQEPRKRASSSKDLFLELALFFDQKAYEMFMPHVKSDDGLLDLILGFVNQMQALYHQPSLKRKLHISLVRLEIMQKQPSDLPHAEGERDKLLDSFCAYQEKKNPGRDGDDPKHWDMALYISGLNFFAMEKGEMSGITMGLAPVGGVCMKKHSCVIAEFGTVSEDGKPYPSAGLLSTYVAVHEIGHNLGMLHDGPPNNKCPPNGHVMSPSRGTKGETTWSTCSSDVLKKLSKGCLTDSPHPPDKKHDHTRFKERPGQVWNAHDQCKIFLRDEDATLLNDTVISLICEQTLCKTPHRIGYYAAGPALEGTYCGGTKWCKSGKCTAWGSEKPKVVKGGWSDWGKGKCQAGCVTKSRGVQMDKRTCDNPKPQNTEKSCDGDNIRIHFCDDSKQCKDRKSPEDFASERCSLFSQYMSDITPVGVQVKYNEGRLWQSCAVYCKMKSGTWYTPRQELNDRGINTFFPDGTWCYNNGKADFYCQNRLCLPPAPKGRSLDLELGASRYNPEIDVQLLNNANPKGNNAAPEILKEYFRYEEGKKPPPIPGPDQLKKPKEEDYEIIDYVSPMD